MHMHAGEELFSARMAYEAWVAPSLEAAGCVAPRFCGVGTDRSPLIIDAARDVPQLVESQVTAGWRRSSAARPMPSLLGRSHWVLGICWVASDDPHWVLGSSTHSREERPSRLDYE